VVGVAGVWVEPLVLLRGEVGASGGHQGTEDLNLQYTGVGERGKKATVGRCS